VSKINEFQDKTLPLECEFCQNSFYKETKQIRSDLKLGKNKCRFCSPKCFNASREVRILATCANCEKTFAIRLSTKKQSKSGNNFCSKSCAGTYNNTHKTKGNRRSKLEAWLEKQLTNKYPLLNILYNHKEIINSELDIYIPSLKIAFELNGIFSLRTYFWFKKIIIDPK
jgi:hypothetical protein